MPHCAPAGMLSARLTPLHAGSSNSVAAQVRRILALASSPPIAEQRRQAQRTPFPHLIRVHAVDPHTLAAVDEPLVVVGKFLSEQGLGFFHQAPLAHRFAVVTLELYGGEPVRLLLDVSWCRFTRLGWYESGGRFLGAVE
jgi:hypothetical protein